MEVVTNVNPFKTYLLAKGLSLNKSGAVCGESCTYGSKGEASLVNKGVDSTKESGVIQEDNISESKVALVYGQMVRQFPYNHLMWKGGKE
jgi:hypothetical protein